VRPQFTQKNNRLLHKGREVAYIQIYNSEGGKIVQFKKEPKHMAQFVDSPEQVKTANLVDRRITCLIDTPISYSPKQCGLPPS
jgi:hypothetical protein